MELSNCEVLIFAVINTLCLIRKTGDHLSGLSFIGEV